MASEEYLDENSIYVRVMETCTYSVLEKER